MREFSPLNTVYRVNVLLLVANGLNVPFLRSIVCENCCHTLATAWPRLEQKPVLLRDDCPGLNSILIQRNVHIRNCVADVEQ